LAVGKAVGGAGKGEKGRVKTGWRAACGRDIGMLLAAVVIGPAEGHVEMGEIGPALGGGRQGGAHHRAEKALAAADPESEDEGARRLAAVGLGEDQLVPISTGAVEGQELRVDKEGRLGGDPRLEGDMTTADDRPAADAPG